MKMLTPMKVGLVAGTVALPAALLVLVAPLLAESPASAQGADSLNFLVISGWGGNGGRSQVAVATQMGRTAKAQKSNFVIACGDNCHARGISSAHSARRKTEYEEVV